MKMPMVMKLKIVMQTKEFNGKRVVVWVTREVRLEAKLGSVRSATSVARLQVIFANQRNVSYN